MKRNAKIGLWAGAVALFTLLFLLTTNPQNLSPIILILPFILFFLLLFMASIYIILSITGTGRKTTMNPKKLLLAVLASGYPVMLLILQSIGQLSARDVITLTLLLVIAGFYVTKTSLGSMPDK